MTNAPSPTPAPTPPPADTPTGHHINADRPCARCGFNLFGQPLVREHHYGLIAARCPECGQLAALQEYPALGRWADRWARTLAALWIVMLIVAAGAQFGPSFGMLIAGVEVSSEDFAHTIAVAYDEDTRTAATAYPSGAMGGSTRVDTAWWREHGDAHIASEGGRIGALDSRFTWFLTPLNIISFAAGIFWSVCLLGARRRSVVIPAMLPLAVAFAVVWLAHRGALSANATTAYAHDIATETAKWVVLPVLAGTAALSLLLGVWQGRRVARTVVRLSLPPRMRSSLAILWTRDGLPSPATGIA